MTPISTSKLAGGIALATSVATLAVAAPASAGLRQEFSVFADCPVNVPGVITCVYSKVTSGEFALGSKTVAISKPVILQGAISSTSKYLVGAADGNTLSHTPLTVPGGLVGVEGVGGEVTATAELAGPVELNGGNLLTAHGTAVALPLKIKLDNPGLGSACYIGSESEPVALALTTGTTNPPPPNKPITGSVGHLSFSAGEQITTVSGNSLVDNAFAVPGANGCGGLLSLVIDPAVDLSAGIPAAAGHNTAIMNGTLETSPSAAVRNQEALPEIGRCVLAESTGEGRAKVYHGSYADPGCTIEISGHEGEYEWLTGAGAKGKFKGKSMKVTLEGVGGSTVSCSSSSSSGEYTGAKTATATVTLKGCKSATTKKSCQSAGAASGEILTSPLAGTLGFIQDEVTGSGVLASVGLDLSHAPSLLSAECGLAKEALTLTGSVIGPIGKLDKMSPSFAVTYQASGGKQVPEGFEEEPKDTLVATLGSGAEQAGLTTRDTLRNEESLEIKATEE